MRVFINAILVHTFLNLYVFWWGWRIIPARLKYRVPYAALFLAELIVYLVGFVYIDEISTDLLYPIMQLGTSWMVFILYMTILLLAYDALKLSGRWVKTIPRRLNPGSLKRRRFYYFTSVVFVCAAMLYGNYRFWHPVVNEIEVQVDKESPLKDIKIVMVSDIHVGYMINRNVLKMYIDRIMEQKPDLILIVGDIIDYNLNPVEEQYMEEEFKRLKAPYGVYASVGNHEYRLNAEEKIQWLSKEAGLTVLRDSVVKVEDAFYIVGRDDFKNKEREPLSKLMHGVDRQFPVIVMNHQPRNLAEESDEGADLAVYGHTHNGQLFPYNILINLIYEVGHGYKKKENTHIYVSSGLGLSGPQYRIGTVSEIVVIDMKTR